jgi:hypothetical protein
MEKQTGIINDFTTPEANITIEYESGNPYSGTLTYNVQNPELTQSAYDFMDADDPESYVAGTYYKKGNDEWHGYTEPLTMPEGEYPFAAYSTDNHGYREPDTIINLSIDATPPQTEAIIVGTKGAGIYYHHPLL